MKRNDPQENLKLGRYLIDPGCSVQMECMRKSHPTLNRASSYDIVTRSYDMTT